MSCFIDSSGRAQSAQILFACILLNITLADIANAAEHSKVLQRCFATFAPRNHMIDVQESPISSFDATELASGTIAHEDKGTQPPINIPWAALSGW